MTLASGCMRTHGLRRWHALCTSTGERNRVTQIPNFELEVQNRIWSPSLHSENLLGGAICYACHKFSAKVRDMKSDHIVTRRLYEAVMAQAILEQSEIEHLQICD